MSDNWVLSFPILATILSLMQNPYKGIDTSYDNDPYSVRDLSWCLDSLQGFCRLRAPGEGDRDLSFSLGTFSDCWVYLSFILHFFEKDEGPDYTDRSSIQSGLRCDRRSINVPNIGSFKERRVLINTRFATAYQDKKPTNTAPSAVNVILTDIGHRNHHISTRRWYEYGMQSTRQAPGVSLFLTVLWDHLDLWEDMWNRCLDNVNGIYQTKV
jgi:hypothetical protein